MLKGIMKRKVILALINVILLTGCWDMREIDELGLVMAVGIDKAENSNNYIVTVQIANPKPAEASKSDKSSASQAVWVASAEGETIFDAVRQLVKISAKRIMWAHNNIVIIGESLARDGIAPVIDYFTHNPELRMKTFVVVSKGNAKEYVASTSSMENIPGLALAEVLRYSKLSAEGLETDLLSLSASFFGQDTQPVISAISFKKAVIQADKDKPQGESETIELAGAAVFKKDKMSGWLSPEQTRGVAWIANITHNAIVTVVEPGQEYRKVCVEITNVKADITSQINGSIPSVIIKIAGTGSIVEEDGMTNLSMNEFKKEIEKLVADKISADCKLSMSIIQKEYKSDILNFAKIIHVQHGKEWENAISHKWQSIFPIMPVSVEVDINISDSALIQEPAKAPKKEGDATDESENR